MWRAPLEHICELEGRLSNNGLTRINTEVEKENYMNHSVFCGMNMEVNYSWAGVTRHSAHNDMAHASSLVEMLIYR